MSNTNPTPEDLARDLLADLALCDAVDGPPWVAWHMPCVSPCVASEPYGGVAGMRTIPVDRADMLRPQDAAFIAAARTALPAALRRALSAEAELERLRHAWAKEAHDIQQTLGKALGYPPLYPHASEADDGQVCVGEHVTETLATEVARRIARVEEVLRSVTRDYPSGHLVVSVIRERLAKEE